MRLAALTALMALALAVAACKPAPAPEPAAAPAEAALPATAAEAAAEANVATSEPLPPPLPTGDFRIVAIEMDSNVDEEGRALQAKTAFAPGDAIHAAVIGVGSSEGLTVSARLLGPGGSEQAKAGQSLVPTQPTVVSFAFSQPEPWPVGAYTLEVAINERVVQSQAFTVQ